MSIAASRLPGTPVVCGFPAAAGNLCPVPVTHGVAPSLLVVCISALYTHYIYGIRIPVDVTSGHPTSEQRDCLCEHTFHSIHPAVIILSCPLRTSIEGLHSVLLPWSARSLSPRPNRFKMQLTSFRWYYLALLLDRAGSRA